MFASCEDDTDKEEKEENNLPSDFSTDERARVLTIAGNELSKYKIVYEAPDPTLVKLKKKLTTEYDFGMVTAKKLAQRIRQFTGLEISYSSDSNTPESEFEILVGNTNRAQSELTKKLMIDSYKVEVNSAKLIFDGGCNGSTYASVNDFVDYLMATVEGEKSIDLAEGYSYAGEHKMISVACVGDSITAGAGASNRTYTSWPAVLSRLLWKDYCVVNYGNSGKTMRNDLADAYNKTSEYKALMKDARDVDIAFIMLGTNDSNRDQKWTTDDDKLFNDSCEELMSLLKAKNPEMKFYIMNCPIYEGTGNYGSARIRKLQENLVKTLSAKGYDVGFYDMYTFTKDVLTISLFPDKLHPGDLGYSKIAAEMQRFLESEAIKESE